MTTTPLPPLPVPFSKNKPHYTSNQVLLYAQQARADLEAEVLEQGRIIGMGAERELALMGRVERLEAENARLREALLACYPIIKAEKFVQDGSYGCNHVASKAERVRKAYELTRTALENTK